MKHTVAFTDTFVPLPIGNTKRAIPLYVPHLSCSAAIHALAKNVSDAPAYPLVFATTPESRYVGKKKEDEGNIIGENL